ncbi:MAG TPA: methyltransferase domain-containing protein [Steroidobacteraceae bacterium]|nr:methyltransferase domain-containing protein [Steroidobacteraceae bacterium]
MIASFMRVARASSTAVIVAAVLAGCAASSQSGPVPLSVADYSTVLADAGRPAADKADDAARKPAEVLAFAQIRPGDTVLELEAGRGWYSDILSVALGASGRLIIQYPSQFNYGDAAFKARTDAGRLKNATITVTAFDKLQAADGSVDKVLWILGPHEVYFTPRNAEAGVLGNVQKTYSEIARVLKPGGTFIAMDHAASAGAPTTTGQTIHRVDPAVVLAAAKAAGLQYVDKSDVLANPTDDRSKPVFDATVRRHTDQFLFRFRKAK